MESQALWITLQLAAVTTLILVTLAVPLAWWISQGRGTPRALVQALVALPLVLPPTVIGFYMLVGLGPLTFLGRSITRLLGHPLAFSFAGLVLGSVIYSLPFAVQPLVSGFRGVSREYLDAATGIGMSTAATFFQVMLPGARRSLATAAVLTFTHTIGEFGVVLMVGGNIPGITRTLSLELFDQVQDFQYAAANRTAIALLLVSTAALILVYGKWLGQDAHAPE